MTRRCSHCGHNGHNARTCPDRGVRLFGVRLSDDAMRKSVSLSNLNNYASTVPQAESLGPDVGGMVRDGYMSDGLVQHSSRERKKGIPWSEDEHRLFLLGLRKLGKGDWRGISRHFVHSRTPTQVASHAQKYFIRQTNLSKRKRRSSLFDMSPEMSALPKSQKAAPVEDVRMQQQPISGFHQPPLQQGPPPQAFYDARVHPFPAPMFHQAQPCGALTAALSSGQGPVPAFQAANQLRSVPHPASHYFQPSPWPAKAGVQADQLKGGGFSKQDMQKGTREVEVARPVALKPLPPQSYPAAASQPSLPPLGSSPPARWIAPFAPAQPGAFYRVQPQAWPVTFQGDLGLIGQPTSLRRSSTKICRPTASLPSVVRPDPESGSSSPFTSPAGSPPMEPSPLSYKLLQPASRQSAFQRRPSSFGGSNLAGSGAISVS